jgi:biotin carboxyl carrier protein
MVNGEEIELEFVDGIMMVQGRPIDASLVEVGPATYSLLLDGKSYEVTVQPNGRGSEITESGTRSEVRLLDRASILLDRFEGSRNRKKRPLEIQAPMPGLVLAVEVQEGDTVVSGQGVIVLEAMKMENEILSTVAGIVSKVHVGTRDAVTKGQVMVTLAAD